ncbi:MAG TPA: OmpA family protein [Bacteroidales bacterium]|nr:OmpA family protein [Bacteroidales bacterium]
MNKRTLLFVLLLAIVAAIPTFGQIKEAKTQMNRFNYSEAVSILKKTISKNNPKTINEATLLIAECYRKQNDMLNTRAWYGRVLMTGNTDPMNFYYYGQALRATGEYRKAKIIFLHYDSITSKDNLGKIYAAYCDSAIAWQSNPPAYEIKNASALNSKQSDFGPAFYDNGVIFTSDRILSKLESKKYGWTGNSFLHLFCADPLYLDDYYNDFEAPKLAPGLLNQEYHDGPATFNKTYTEIFLNRTLVYKDKGKKENKNIRTHLLKIFYATRKDGKWGKLKPFFFNNDEYSVGHPALSPDGKTLYFVSDMKGGLGGTDIYVCTREDGKWSNPTNLGAVINTFGNEMFPFIADSLDLYFASDGHPGFGGLDIFVSRMVDGKWTTPKNLGLPINSSYDDFSLAEYKNTGKGLFCSNRPNGKGADDLYCFNRIPVEQPKPPVTPLSLPMVSGCVKDKSTLEPIQGATVFLLDNESRKVLVIKANSNGCFKTPVKKGTHYLVKAMQNGYIADCLPFNFDTADTRTDLSIPRDLLLDKLAVNRKFRLENIYYDFDKWNIRKDAEPSLNNLIRIMKENAITVELGSHTDCRGSDEYNLRLSQHRAESAVQYIVSAGIDPSRITAHGYGEIQLVNKCRNGVPCTESEHQANRRTEFKVLSSYEDKTNGTFNPEKFGEGEIIDSRFLSDGFFFNCSLEIAYTPRTDSQKGEIEKSVIKPAIPEKEIVSGKTEPKTDHPKKTNIKSPAISYRVQFMINPKVISLHSVKFSDLPDVRMYHHQGMFKYTTGEGKSVEDVMKFLDMAKNKGFKDAFIVAFKGEERITISEAKKLQATEDKE